MVMADVRLGTTMGKAKADIKSRYLYRCVNALYQSSGHRRVASLDPEQTFKLFCIGAQKWMTHGRCMVSDT